MANYTCCLVCLVQVKEGLRWSRKYKIVYMNFFFIFAQFRWRFLSSFCFMVYNGCAKAAIDHLLMNDMLNAENFIHEFKFEFKKVSFFFSFFFFKFNLTTFHLLSFLRNRRLACSRSYWSLLSQQEVKKKKKKKTPARKRLSSSFQELGLCGQGIQCECGLQATSNVPEITHYALYSPLYWAFCSGHFIAVTDVKWEFLYPD